MNDTPRIETMILAYLFLQRDIEVTAKDLSDYFDVNTQSIHRIIKKLIDTQESFGLYEIEVIRRSAKSYKLKEGNLK